MSPLDEAFDKVVTYVNIGFTIAFTIECVLKMYAFNPKVCLDVIVVVHPFIAVVANGCVFIKQLW